jgi:nucleotide-binding universal stress UspA family protein
MDRTIVVGYDGSEGAEDALALAELLATATGGRAAPAFVAHGEEDERAAEAAVLLRRRAGGPDGRPATLTLRSARSTAEGLAQLADSTGAGAIVVGSSHRGPLGQVLGGSVPQSLLSGGPCAVAVAPRKPSSDRG